MTFIHAHWSGKRDYETTNVVAAEADHSPGIAWKCCDKAEFDALITRGIVQLWIENGVRYLGWL